MKSLQLHRSLGFWLGLLPAVFLLWLGADSRDRLSAWGRASGPRLLHLDRVAITGCEILFEQTDIVFKEGSTIHTHFTGGFERGKIPASDIKNRRCSPAPRGLKRTIPHVDMRNSGKSLADLEIRGFAIPLWLLLSVYLVVGIGLLVWWRKRKQGFANPDALPSQP